MMILRNGLHRERPVHPRRTLDQSYYLKLDDTDSRDKDQVVNRGKKAAKKIHKAVWLW